MEIRAASANDLVPIVAILNHYILNSMVTFEELPQTIDDRRGWFDRFGSTGPYRLVVADDGGLCGWACSSPYGDHPAFAKTVEFSVCFDPARRRGLGTLLYQRLLARLDGEDLHRAVAGIVMPNDASVALHRKVGFTEVGIFDEYARKNGHYMSLMWLQRPL